MATAIEKPTIADGFYYDPETKKTFFVNKGMVPPWVKSRPDQWRLIKKKGKK